MRSAVDRAGFEMSLDVVYGSDEEGAPLSECLDNSSSISTPIPDLKRNALHGNWQKQPRSLYPNLFQNWNSRFLWQNSSFLTIMVK